MISKTIRKLTTLLLAAAMLITVFQGISVPVRAAGQSSAKAAFAALKQDYELYGVLTNDADIPVYKQADTGAAVIKTLPSGSQVTLTDAVWDTQTLWFKIGFAANGTAYSGYVESRYVATADARLAGAVPAGLCGTVIWARRRQKRREGFLLSGKLPPNVKKITAGAPELDFCADEHRAGMGGRTQSRNDRQPEPGADVPPRHLEIHKTRRLQRPNRYVDH